MLRKVEKSKNLVFKNHYKSLSNEDKEKIRRRWTDCSGMSEPSFIYKLRNEIFMPLEIDFLLKELKTLDGYECDCC